MFKTRSLRAKLLGMFAPLSLLLVAMGTLSFIMLRNVVFNFDHIAEVNLPNTLHLGKMSTAFRDVRLELRTLGVDGLTKDEEKTIADNVRKSIEAFEKADAEYRSIPFEPGEQEHYEAVKKEWDAFKAEGLKQLRLALSENPADRATFKEFVLHTCPKMAQTFYDQATILENYQLKEAKLWGENADRLTSLSNRSMVAIILGGGLLSLLLGAWITRQIHSQLSGMVTRLNSGAGEIAHASVQVSSASEQLSASATEQAASLQQTSASVTELSQMVAKNAENAQAASQTSKESQAKASEGRAAVEQMIQAIQEIDQSTLDISTQVEESNREIGQIIKVIADIQDKTKVINDIVFQTKLLSFNASVEAARAGEHGKGFAVVAEEVGNLAQMSGNASKEISSLLASSLENVERTIRESQSKVSTLVESSKGKVRTGSEVAQHCGEVLTALVDTAATVNQLAQEISVASQEQASGIREIDQAVGQLDQVTQQNSAAAGQTANSATELSSQAAELRQVVQELTGLLNGSAHHAHFEAPRREPHVTRTNTARARSSVQNSTKPQTAKVFPLHKSEKPRAAESRPSKDKPTLASGEIPSQDDRRFRDI